MLLRKRKLLCSRHEDVLVLGVRTPNRLLVEFGASVSRIYRNTLIISLYLT
jgi:hypothetical protein